MFRNFSKKKQKIWKFLEVLSGSEPAAILRDLHASQLAGKNLVENARIFAL